MTNFASASRLLLALGTCLIQSAQAQIAAPDSLLPERRGSAIALPKSAPPRASRPPAPPPAVRATLPQDPSFVLTGVRIAGYVRW